MMINSIKHTGITTFILMTGLIGFAQLASAESMDSYKINTHGSANTTYPAWFKHSFLDFREDLDDVRKANKKGLIIFFSQVNCSHCEAFVDVTMDNKIIKQRVDKNYDVIVLDIFNDVEVTDIDGKHFTIKDFAEKHRARLTPTLLFITPEHGQILKIIGFYPPEKFSRVLDYIEGDHYQNTKLGQFLQKNKSVKTQTQYKIQIDNNLFATPSKDLSRRNNISSRPTMVFFEKPDCNPCKRFHERVLTNKKIRKLMKNYNAVQIDSSDNKQTLVTPAGKKITQKQWARDLNLVYDYSIIFFDTHGREVHRLDAETGSDRMTGSLQYVLEKAYLTHEQFLRWRRHTNKKNGRQTGSHF